METEASGLDCELLEAFGELSVFFPVPPQPRLTTLSCLILFLHIICILHPANQGAAGTLATLYIRIFWGCKSRAAVGASQKKKKSRLQSSAPYYQFPEPNSSREPTLQGLLSLEEEA